MTSRESSDDEVQMELEEQSQEIDDASLDSSSSGTLENRREVQGKNNFRKKL